MHKKFLANAARFLALDMIEAAQSGHPGMPFGMADVVTELFMNHLVFNPQDPIWSLRDRLIFSAGHGSALLYACLHLAGYDYQIDDLKKFRQIGSVTPGHPELDVSRGVEATTGPLGQGFAMAVGMALASKIKDAGRDHKVNNIIYTVCGDGCMAEGVTQEAISIAGHLGLDNLIVLFDDNGITIDGSTKISTSEDHIARVRAAGWFAIQIDGHSTSEINNAIEEAKAAKAPAFIACKTKIGYGIPGFEGSAKVHGAAVGAEVAKLTREAFAWKYDIFEVPQEALYAWRTAWRSRFTQRHGVHGDAVEDSVTPEILSTIRSALSELEMMESWSDSTRNLSAKVLERLYAVCSCIIGGSADLSISNCTRVSASVPIERGMYAGSYINYGIREHVMGAMMNGIALYGGFIPYGGTFMVFADYMRPAIRLSALMRQRVIYVMTHDSIGVGEDGPTHQPVEHLASLRCIPNMHVFRPCNTSEVAASWKMALTKCNGPSVISLSRQKFDLVEKPHEFDPDKGAYLICGSKKAEVAILATGSEVAIALEVFKKLSGSGVNAKVISVLSLELLLNQSKTYIEELIGDASLRVVIEAGIRACWDRLLQGTDMFFGVEQYGASGPFKEVYELYGLEATNITEVVLNQLKDA